MPYNHISSPIPSFPPEGISHVTTQEAVFPSTLTVIAADPLLIAVIFPLESTVATEGLEDVQTVPLTIVEFDGLIVTERAKLLPTISETSVLFKDTELTGMGWAETVT